MKMKEVRIQMFRNDSRDFYQQVVYKFKARNIASKDSRLSNFEKIYLCHDWWYYLSTLSYKKTPKVRIP